jgi:non-ribosomal peptide synthetase component E (peptide arylation enzyme)
MAMAGWVAMDGTAALSPSAAFRAAARHFVTHTALVEKHLWLSAAAAEVSAAAAAAEMLRWATKGNKEMGKGRKGGEAAAAALCHFALLT